MPGKSDRVRWFEPAARQGISRRHAISLRPIFLPPAVPNTARPPPPAPRGSAERQHQKLLNERARCIQAAWRATLAARAGKDGIRTGWDAEVQKCGAQLQASAVADITAVLAQPRFLAEFNFFHSREVDRERRAAVCDLVLKSVQVAAVGGGGGGGGSGGADSFAVFDCQSDPETRQRYQLLLRRLLCICLDAVAAAGADGGAAGHEMRLLLCLTDSETWHAGGYSKQDASCLCWQFLNAL
eukprot:SAG22_NODE_5537_length_997_cov_1.317372_1_plen_240_part_10